MPGVDFDLDSQLPENCERNIAVVALGFLLVERRPPELWPVANHSTWRLSATLTLAVG